MITRSGWLYKKPDWTTQEFRRYWIENHGAIAETLPNLLRYDQNHVVDRTQRGFTSPRGPENLDGVSMLWFEDEATMRAAINTDAGRALAEDEKILMGDINIIADDQTTIIAPPADGPMVKQLALIKRRPDVSAAAFQEAWSTDHARLVAQLPGIRGYRQNLIKHREAPKGNVVDYDGLPVDGMSEIWFDDLAALDAAFASPEGRALQAQTDQIISEITTFMIEVHVVV